MSVGKSFISSTIGQKQLVGLTGLALCLFVLSHVLGNFLIFVGPEAYNTYSHVLISNPFIEVIEAGLVLVFISHLGLALKITINNKKARPQGYAVQATGDKGTGLISKTMWHQGMIILAFVIFHLITFKFGTVYQATYDGVEMRDLYRLMIDVFNDPLYVLGYVVCLIVLGLHLSHGLSSAIQTLGFNHPKYTPKVEKLGYLYACFVVGGFIIQPLYIYFLK